MEVCINDFSVKFFFSYVSSGFGHINEEIFNEKFHFLCSEFSENFGELKGGGEGRGGVVFNTKLITQ